MQKVLFSIALVLSFALSHSGLAKASDKPPRKLKGSREFNARKQLNAGEPGKVIALLNPYTDQLSIPAYLDLANAYGSLGDTKNEVRVLRILNDRDEDNYESHFVLGHGLLKLLKETKKEAEKTKIEADLVNAFRQSIKLRSKFKPAYDTLLNYFVESSLNYEGRQLLAQMVERFGKRPELLNDQCRLYSIDGYLNQTVETCKEAIAKSKSYPDNYVYLGQAYIEKGNEDKGGKIIRMTAQKFPNSEITQWAAGKFYFDKSNYPVSSRYFTAAVKANPNKDRSQMGLGTSLFEEGKYKPALLHMMKACELNQSHKEAILVKATQLRLERKSTFAEQYKRKASSCVARGNR